MQGTISFDGTLSGGITGGGGGGSEVTITPTLQSGTKIADYSIDQEAGSLYAPTPPVVPEHIVTDIHGFSYTPYPSAEVARYTIDNGEEQSIRTPDYTTTWEAYPGVDQDYTIGILRCYGSTFYVKIPYYQKPLTAGTNITIDQDNVISASSGSLINYVSDTKIGTWDGGDLYQAELTLDVRNGRTFDLSTLNIAKVRQMSAFEEGLDGDYMIKLPYYESNNYWAYFQYRNTTKELSFVGSNNNFSGYPIMRVIIEYKKSV